MASRASNKEPPELDITAFLNLMVVLVPFLLITAVFSRITVLQLNLPEEAGAAAAADLDAAITIEVIVLEDRLQLADGEKVIQEYPNLPPELDRPEEPAYNWDGLNATLVSFRQNLPDDKKDATILMANKIKYNYMVKAMDSVTYMVTEDATGNPTIYSLFPDVSFGDAPEG
ncbi:MAG: biopolymer transporter ExbD [Gammaproteobacteria bacterium]|nr:biopolymer transporter ExbD [Pseudomonadota bacterium]MCH9662271.1 biopolymer transporter ExbD [Gammaproteobacteria bacterium]